MSDMAVFDKPFFGIEAIDIIVVFWFKLAMLVFYELFTGKNNKLFD